MATLTKIADHSRCPERPVRSVPIAQLLRPREVAEILKVHISHVYRLAYRGTLPSVLIPPRTRRFRAADIEAFLTRCRVPAIRQVKSA